MPRDPRNIQPGDTALSAANWRDLASGTKRVNHMGLSNDFEGFNTEGMGINLRTKKRTPFLPHQVQRLGNRSLQISPGRFMQSGSEFLLTGLSVSGTWDVDSSYMISYKVQGEIANPTGITTSVEKMPVSTSAQDDYFRLAVFQTGSSGGIAPATRPTRITRVKQTWQGGDINRDGPAEGENYHFKLVPSIGGLSTSTPQIKIINGTWTRNATRQTDPTYSTAGLSLTGTEGQPPDTLVTPTLVDIDDASGISTSGTHYIVLQLLPDINNIVSGNPDPNLLPTALYTYAIKNTAWLSGVKEAKYSHHNQRILGSVTVDSGLLITRFEQYYFGGNIDDTCIVPDHRTNAFQSPTPALDDSVAFTLNFNDRGELGLLGSSDPGNNEVTSPTWVVCMDEQGGQSSTKPRLRYTTLDDISGNVNWCDLINDTGTSCFDSIVEEIIGRSNNYNTSGQRIIHGELLFLNRAQVADANTDRAQDGRYWFAKATVNVDGGAGGGTDRKDYGTSGHVEAQRFHLIDSSLGNKWNGEVFSTSVSSSGKISTGDVLKVVAGNGHDLNITGDHDVDGNTAYDGQQVRLTLVGGGTIQAYIRHGHLCLT